MFNRLLKINTDLVFRFQFPVFFIPIFIALFVVYGYSEIVSNVLDSFNGRMLGIATLENVDASFRVSLFYRSLFLLAGVFFVFNALINYILKIKSDFIYLLEPAGYISILGLFSFLFFITLGEGLSVVYFSFFALLSLSLLGILKAISGKAIPNISSTSFFIWIVWLAIILFFIVDCFGKWLVPGMAFPFNITVAAISLILSVILFFKNLDEAKFRVLTFVLSPLTFIPLMIFTSAELAMICNQRNISSVGSFGVFMVLFLLMLLWVYLKYRKWTKNNEIANNDSLKKYIPAFLIGIIALVVWTPFQTLTPEMFELANPANALMRIFSFKEIPLISFLNSHLISEIATGFLYFFLNTYDGTIAFVNYDFIYIVFIGLLIYYFINRITGSYIIAMVFCLFLPFVQQLASESFIFSLVILFSILSLYNKSRGAWLSFWIIILVLALFRPDMAFAMLFAIVFLVFSIPGFLSGVSVKKSLLALSIVAFPIILITSIIVIVRDIPLFQNLHQALMYFTANQSHGALQVIPAFDRIAITQYFVIPFVLLVLLVYVLSRRKKLFSENPMLFAGMVFMIVFYFANFQRGLLRHGFNEGHDGFLASFSFLILSLTPYLLFSIRKEFLHIMFLFFAFLLVWLVGLPEPKGEKSVFEQIGNLNTEKFQVVAGQPKINRIKEEGDYLNNIKIFKEFVNANLSKEKTFFDLSNSPMLYYYTQKKVPSYFNQGIQNVVTDRLQQYMLSELQKYDMPFCVFSNVPATWFDATDDVPNALRYYRISEYVFSHYHPWAIVGGHAVWLRNDLTSLKGSFLPDTITGGVCAYEIKKLPYVWAQYEQDNRLKIIKTFSVNELTVHGMNYTAFIDSTVISPNGNYIDINVTCTTPGEQQYILDFGKDWEIYGQFEFVIVNKNAIENYRIRVSTMWRWFDKKNNFVRVRPKDNSGGVSINSLTITEAD